MIELFGLRTYNQRQDSGTPDKASVSSLTRPSVPLSTPHNEV